MQAYYRVGSITNAIRAKRILEKYGIRAYMRRRSDNEGCGYGIFVSEDSPSIAAWLKSGGVTVYQ